MTEKHITVNKTVRYFVLGEPNEKVSHIWFVCHGYGQLANFFLKNFGVLDNGENLIVAPEGMHRFYWGGFDGKVVASWMTKEDRESDIRDYVQYLDLLYETILNEFIPSASRFLNFPKISPMVYPERILKSDFFRDKNRKIKITILGFSQGVATVCRWMNMGKAKADNLILWAGVFPPDLKFDADENVFSKMKTTIVVGNSDEFLKDGQLEEYENAMKRKGIKYQLIRFEGKHEIDSELLKKINL